ncbi:MAG: permease [Planctomycetes bacterium]|nr:permease [Actinomycetota bacterium]MBU4273931.1 permease [Planctomycetota bacterium]
MQAFRDFYVVLFSILLEATPFLLFGVLVSATLSVYVSDDFLMKWFPKRTFMALFYALVLGFLFPVCECGNIPVARRLMAKGVPHGAVITFLLAAPVLNPVVIIVTLAAFPGQPEILWLRLVFTIVISLAVGGIFSMVKKGDVVKAEIGRAGPLVCCEAVSGIDIDEHACSHDHESDDGLRKGHIHGGHECAGYDHYKGLPRKQRFIEFLFVVRNEFIEMLRLLVLGAVIAAAFRTLVPQGFVNKLGTSQTGL